MKKNSLQKSRLYAVLAPEDAERIGLAIEDAARQAVLGGAEIVQLRDKSVDDDAVLDRARRIIDAIRPLGGLFVINDRPEVALKAGADGVHLGQDDMPLREAREMLGPDFIIGLSTHSLRQALAAEEEGADYIGYGPIFATPTKPSYTPVGPETIGEVARRVRVPVFAIGGIDHSRVGGVLKNGANRVAVVRAAFENYAVFESVRKLKKELLKYDAPPSL